MTETTHEIRHKTRLAVGVAWFLLAASLALADENRAADSGYAALMLAQTEAEIEAEMEAREAELEAQEEELEMQLREANERLEEAAREVAELSAQLAGDATVLSRGGLYRAREPRPMLGINLGARAGLENDGVLIQGVTPGGPAEKAGIRSGDIVKKIDGTSLTGGAPGSATRRLTAHMKDVEAGDEVKLVIDRDGKEMEFTVVPEDMDPIEMAFSLSGRDWDLDLRELEKELEELELMEDFDHPGPHRYRFSIGTARRWGDMELVSLTPELGEYFGAEKGVLVVRAPSDETLKLKDGDVIVDIGGREPMDPPHAMRVLRSYEEGEILKLGIVRKKKRRTLEIEIPGPDLSRHYGAGPKSETKDTRIILRRGEDT